MHGKGAELGAFLLSFRYQRLHVLRKLRLELSILRDITVESRYDLTRRLPWLICRAGDGFRREPRVARSKSLARLRRRYRLPCADAHRRHRCPPAAGRRASISLLIGGWPALREFGFDFLITQSWNPVTEKFGALAPIYGTHRHLAHRHADRRAGRSADRDVPDRAVPACSCGGRSASRSSCSPAFPASSTASGACSCSRRSCRIRCSRS